MSHGKRHLRTKDGLPVAAVLSQRLTQPGLPIVRTLTHACFYGDVRGAASKVTPWHHVRGCSPWLVNLSVSVPPQ